MPTALERSGDFSQSLDNNGKPIPQLKDPNGGIFAGNIIPANRMYGAGLEVLNRYPMPNVTQVAGTNYNLEIPRPAGQPPAPAAGRPRRLPVLAVAARHRQVLRPA